MHAPVLQTKSTLVFGKIYPKFVNVQTTQLRFERIYMQDAMPVPVKPSNQP